MARYLDDNSITCRLELEPGDVIGLDHDRASWTVQAVSEHYVACVRPMTDAERDDPDDPDGDMDDMDPSTVVYTVLDWRNGVRGPCNLIGQGWGDGTYSAAECAEMLDAFERGPVSLADEDDRGEPLRVSQRNWVPLNVYTIRRARTTETEPTS